MAFTDQRGRTQTSLSEINVTPLVDVMLVLLVIFMVTAPILQTGIEVNLPKTQEVRAEQPKPKAVVVSIDKEGNLYLSTQAEAKQVNVNDLPGLLSEKLGQSGSARSTCAAMARHLIGLSRMCSISPNKPGPM